MEDKTDKQVKKILKGRKYFTYLSLEKGVKNQIQKINYNIETLENNKLLSRDYPYLFRLIKNRKHYLKNISIYSTDKVINYKFEKEGNYVFFASNRYLAKRYKGHTTTWNVNINIFATLGLIKKHDIKTFPESIVKRKAIRQANIKADKLGLSRGEIKTINYYSIPLYDDELLSYANNISKRMVDNNFRANGFSKIYLIKTFSQEFADTVYQDERYVTDFSDYVSKQIEKFILEDIAVHGYTTKKRVLENTYIDTKNVKIREYGFYNQKDSPKHLLSKEFDRTISVILKNNNLKYDKANKELKQRFELEGYITIIYKAN